VVYGRLPMSSTDVAKPGTVQQRHIRSHCCIATSAPRRWPRPPWLCAAVWPYLRPCRIGCSGCVTHAAVRVPARACPASLGLACHTQTTTDPRGRPSLRSDLRCGTDVTASSRTFPDSRWHHAHPASSPLPGLLHRTAAPWVQGIGPT